MSGAPELLRQGTQRFGPGYTIGFLSAPMRSSDAGGGIAARLGISTPDGRRTVVLGPGEQAELPGGGVLRIIDIFVSPDGQQTAAAIEINEPDA